MTQTKDIYFKLGAKLMLNGYLDADIDEKKELIDEELKQYTIQKIHEINPNIIVEDSTQNLSVVELVEILGTQIPKSEHADTISQFVHYILNVAGGLQWRSITWWQEEKETLIQTPEVDFDEHNFWDKLTTHQDTDYVQTFTFVYDVFQYHFMKSNENKQKKLTEAL